ncbi:hypothetical protein [Thalassospira sp. TSL5-1]|uniref:hypothetical protein n=1 Tax=Thalassospira sp. TSL5-1 TaxID=1544451 RepID=UPI0011610369|nr:hypothetical protein [Thalassospira sp. TSL5-1]
MTLFLIGNPYPVQMMAVGISFSFPFGSDLQFSGGGEWSCRCDSSDDTPLDIACLLPFFGLFIGLVCLNGV